MSDEENNSAAEDYAEELFNKRGFVSLKIPEGELIRLKRSYLKSLLANNPDQKEFRILIANPTAH
jgi:hypothetical protein